MVEGYRIERLLGRGGMGEVYEANQLTLNRRVAFKVLARPRQATSPSSSASAARAGCRRRSSIRTWSGCTRRGAPRRPLPRDAARRRARRSSEMIVRRELDAARTVRLLRPVAEALDSAHAAGLVHRDVKPQNILVERGDQALPRRLRADRGGDDGHLTKSGEFVGTAHYAAPEQVRRRARVPASDVYALRRCCTSASRGACPTRGPPISRSCTRTSTTRRRPSSSGAPDLPEGIDAVIAAGMAKAPGDRPESAVGLVDRAASCSRRSARRSRPAGSTRSTARRSPRSRRPPTTSRRRPHPCRPPPSSRRQPPRPPRPGDRGITVVALAAGAFFLGRNGEAARRRSRSPPRRPAPGSRCAPRPAGSGSRRTRSRRSPASSCASGRHRGPGPAGGRHRGRGYGRAGAGLLPASLEPRERPVPQAVRLGDLRGAALPERPRPRLRSRHHAVRHAHVAGRRDRRLLRAGGARAGLRRRLRAGGADARGARRRPRAPRGRPGRAA